MVSQALPEGQFRWTLARSKATSLEKGKKRKSKDGKSYGKHVKGKVKSEKGSGNEKSGGNVQAPAQFQELLWILREMGT